MKTASILFSGLILAGSASAIQEKITEKELDKIVCYSMGTMATGLLPDFMPVFYITSVRDYAACKKKADKEGAKLIIDPNA